MRGGMEGGGKEDWLVDEVGERGIVGGVLLS